VTQFYGKEKMHVNLLEHMDFYVMPVANVDGYDYTWKKVGESKENKIRPCGGYKIVRLNTHRI
jgi:carboxypeptidase B2